MVSLPDLHYLNEGSGLRRIMGPKRGLEAFFGGEKRRYHVPPPPAVENKVEVEIRYMLVMQPACGEIDTDISVLYAGW